MECRSIHPVQKCGSEACNALVRGGIRWYIGQRFQKTYLAAIMYDAGSDHVGSPRIAPLASGNRAGGKLESRRNSVWNFTQFYYFRSPGAVSSLQVVYGDNDDDSETRREDRDGGRWSNFERGSRQDHRQLGGNI